MAGKWGGRVRRPHVAPLLGTRCEGGESVRYRTSSLDGPSADRRNYSRACRSLTSAISTMMIPMVGSIVTKAGGWITPRKVSTPRRIPMATSMYPIGRRLRIGQSFLGADLAGQAKGLHPPCPVGSQYQVTLPSSSAHIPMIPLAAASAVATTPPAMPPTAVSDVARPMPPAMAEAVAVPAVILPAR